MTTYPQCSHGHYLTDENFYVSSKGKKRCRKCAADSGKKWRKKNRIHMRIYLSKYRKEKRESELRGVK